MQNLDLKEKLSDLERNFAIEKKGHRDQKEQSSYMKQEFQDISQEYINLKENYSFLSEEHQNLVFVSIMHSIQVFQFMHQFTCFESIRL